MTDLLHAFPKPGPLYLKAALTARRKPAADATIPSNALQMQGVRFDPEHAAAYNRICGLPETTLALTYPQVVAASLHIALLLKPNYPYPLLGMVHLRNDISQHAPLAIGTAYDVSVRIGTAERTPLGMEVELITEYSREGAVVWQASTVVLHRIKGMRRGPKKPPPAAAPAVAAQYQPFDVPEDIGRRYAPIAGDYNPIHLKAASAKLFGFDRAIAHGMWSLARCLGLLLPAIAGTPQRLTVQFKQPVLLPAKVTLKQVTVGDTLQFDLLAREGGKTHLSGAAFAVPDDAAA